MSKIRVELNSAGVREMLKSAGAAAECMSYAQRIALSCGEGYAATKAYPERTGAIVYAESSEANRDNIKNNTLLRNLS